MRDLFKAEFIRFRSWALGYALAHVALLGLLARLVDLAQQPRLVYQVFAVVYAFTGLLLGMVQMGGYRRHNAWLNLLHRPLARWRIAMALLGAGAVLLGCAIVPSLLAIVGWQELMTARVVDQRHWLLVMSALLIALVGYLAGCHVMLADRRYGFCALLFLPLLFLAEAAGLGAIALQVVALSWLVVMVVLAFKPDLSSVPRGAVATLFTAVPLVMSLYVALRLLGFGAELAWIAQGSHPLNAAMPPPGGAVEADRAKGRDLMIAGLHDSTAADAPLWRAQAAISEISTLGHPRQRLSTRNELTNLVPMQFDDDERRVRWTFSHDCMCFKGQGLLDKRAAGTLQVAGGGAFSTPPVPADDVRLFGRETFYQYDSDSGQVLPRARLPQGEVLLGSATFGDHLVLLGSRALTLYDARELDAGDGLLTAQRRVPLHGRVGDLQRVDLMELFDGALLSFTFTRTANDPGGDPYQQVLRIDARGDVATVARRDLGGDYPAAWRYRGWYASPLLYAVQRKAMDVFAGYLPERDVDPLPVPRSAAAIAIVLLVLSALLALWRTRRSGLTLTPRIAWVTACAALGVPALIALWLLVPIDAVEARLPATSPERA